MLLVDDEIFSIKAMKSGVDWSELRIEEPLEALHVDQAMEIMTRHPVDLVVCDIEMPRKSGLELIKWIKEEHPDTETIMLTCHSEFSYAQKALQLGCIDYLLKPVEYDSLRSTVQKALEKIEKSRDAVSEIKQYRQYYNQWENQLPTLIERFWIELIQERGTISRAYLDANFELYQIPLCSNDRVLPILLSVEHWDKEFSTRDEEILEYALLKAAEETILQAVPGIVVQDRPGLLLALCYVPGRADPNIGQLAELCETYLTACRHYFYCRISSYIGHAVHVEDLPALYRKLQWAEQQNVLLSNRVMMLRDLEKLPDDSRSLSITVGDIQEALRMRDERRLQEAIQATFTELYTHQITVSDLEKIYYELVQTVYAALHKADMSIVDCYTREELRIFQTRPKSLVYLEDWSKRLLPPAIERMGSRTIDRSSRVVEAAREYICNHLDRPISREEIAAYVYLNSAYLSRLFKKETGMSIIDFIIKCRIDKSKLLLETTDHKITRISEMVGYDNFPHFSRQFKKIVGVTPHQYRSKFQ